MYHTLYNKETITMLVNKWLAVPEEKHTRCVLSWDLQCPGISTIGSTQGWYRSKTSTEVLQHTKCSTSSSITRWESLVVTSLQCQYLPRGIYNRTSVEVVGTLHKDSHITMQHQKHYQSMEQYRIAGNFRGSKFSRKFRFSSWRNFHGFNFARLAWAIDHAPWSSPG